MLGLFSYIPTIYGVPHAAFLLCIPILFWRYYKRNGAQLKIQKPFKLGKIEWLLLMIIGLSALNHFLHFDQSGGIREVVPYTILLGLTYFIAVSLNAKDIRILLILGAAETGVLLYELVQGFTTVFTNHPEYAYIGNSEYLYYMRVFGLSENSSVVANKLFVVLILADYFKLKSRWDQVLKIVVLLGILLTFNRTVILVVAFFGLLKGIKWLIKGSWKKQEAYLGFGLIGLGFILSMIVLYVYGDAIMEQFTRGQGQLELSGRGSIWSDFTAFIKENSLFGNGSHKLYIREKYHAHNSYLQVIATHGLLIFILYLLLILFGLTWQNIIFVAPLLLYSVTQYGLFWGISMMDIAFLMMVSGRLSRSDFKLVPD